MSNTFDYLICVDWELSGTGREPPRETEIVEWSFVVFDAANRQRSDTKQMFIRPEVVAPTPAFFERTGYNQTQLTNGITLQQAVAAFDQAMFQQVVCNQKNFTLVTIGSTKIKDYLRTDAANKQVRLAAHYNHFIDLSEEFAKIHQLSSPNIQKICEVAQIPYTATTHYDGLPAAELAAQLVGQLYNAGHVFKTATTIPDSYACDSSRVPATLSPFDPAFDALVRIRGLPFQATENEVRAFFGSLQVLPGQGAVIFMTSPDGRSSGEAFVRFVDAAQADQAMEKHRQNMGTRYIECFRSSQPELTRYLRRLAGGPEAGGAAPAGGAGSFRSVVRMRGLPWSANANDVSEFFARGGFNVPNSEVAIGLGPDGRPSGDAWACLPSDEDADRARTELNKQTLGSRYVELFPSNRGEFQAAVSGRPGGPMGGWRGDRNGPGGPGMFGGGGGGGYGGGGGGGYRGGPSNISVGMPATCLRMRGLPFSASEMEIMTFFQGFQMVSVLPATAPINEKPTGEAYVEFPTIDEASRALAAKQRGAIGHRYIELFYATREEMMAAAAGRDVRMYRQQQQGGGNAMAGGPGGHGGGY
uniref:RRM domain-containing protein n=1 Tax=Chromera velia CCMP2878 TaxID=1169474 RepID=A0A0G4HBR1_9ALVE|eukprot:Cvel_25919.t1-p1 / transcript=Cvel_25919.t1 / gene=Cvel_25919 / organism=Chromera_velia_CCMP2878 / gene_product=Epithelial splicing regulatory protein 1, putative / transcript_product=Epithelial splicing regulatory protein 1, putative / location=Cvel_scaffold2997:3452-10618(+) / protein_length=585 / sequence_SO=supercontig / SO=protein_coding / is_pseudo=false